MAKCGLSESLEVPELANGATVHTLSPCQAGLPPFCKDGEIKDLSNRDLWTPPGDPDTRKTSPQGRVLWKGGMQQNRRVRDR